MTSSDISAAVPDGQFPDPAINEAHRSALRSIARVVEETVEPTPPAQALAQIKAQLDKGPALALTGAGVSTDSGIPDYRSPHGRLTQHRPMTYQEFLHDPAASQRYWARAFVGWRRMTGMKPNRTHFALVELEKAGFINGVVTQNVDGLHRDAGTKNVVHLHGDMQSVVCLDCGTSEDRRHFDERLSIANPHYLASIELRPQMINPDGDVSLADVDIARFRMIPCLNCGSLRLKPDVVYFGENVPPARKEATEQLLNDAASVLVAGSSLAVMSGYRIVLDALKQGKPVAVINGGPGRADQKVDTLWRTRVAPAFDELLDALDL
ncbi:Sir2 family NAD-dependent protein deacetylase [Corynebacterium sp. A21]|uniref:Sir2 family NAD-dependent protein deacetylase n=1 Tax=Corynebacterium sp. A21 TaxID=3457318 RepID=UPI003FCFD353